MYGKAVLTFLLISVGTQFARGADAAALWAGKVQPIFDAHCVKPWSARAEKRAGT
jgi:hypothetical protein